MIQIISKMSTTSKLLFLMLGGMLAMVACKKEEDFGMRKSSGPPSIERIRLTDPTTRDSSLKQTTLGSTIVIIGKHLASAQKVLFNNYSLPVNPVYATEEALIITVHDSVPTIATNPNVPDEIKVITAGGEATYKFKILPPRPEIARISNEYAKPGETVTLFGKYFYFVDTVFLPGNVNVTSGITTNGTSLTFTVPTGVDLTAGDIRVKSQSGISLAGVTSKFYNPGRALMLLNWDDKNAFGWGLNTSTNVKNNQPGIAPIDGKYAVISQNVPGNWGWNNDKVINMNNWSTGNRLFVPAPTAFNAEDPISNYAIKMEMASTTAVDGLQLQVWQPNPNIGDMEVNTALNTWIKSTDAKWYTASVNLGDLAKGSTKMAKFKDLYKASDSTAEMRLVIINPTPADIPLTLAIDNIRIEKVR